MARQSKLTPEQWREVEGRYLSGEGASPLARAFGIDEAMIRRKFVRQSPIVRIAAEKLAEGQKAVAELPSALQPVAIDLAAKLRNISGSLASAAELGAATAHRLHKLAHAEVCRADANNLPAALEGLKTVGILSKIANESSHIALNLLAANKSQPSPGEDAPSGVRVVFGDG